MSSSEEEVVTLCGGGNGVHTMIAIAASKGVRVRVLTLMEREVEALSGDIRAEFVQSGEVRTGRAEVVSTKPEEVVPGSRAVILCVPSFAHPALLEAIAPHLDAGAWVGAFPAMCGWDWQLQQSLEGREFVGFGTVTLPWACRIKEYGKVVQVLGKKDKDDMAAHPREARSQVAEALERWFEMPFPDAGHLCSFDFFAAEAVVHPGIMFGQFGDWDGHSALAEAPLFYQGVDEKVEAVLVDMDAEMQAVKRSVLAAHPGLELTSALPLKDWLMDKYSAQVGDPSSLRTTLNTNAAYAGLRSPTHEVDGKLVPLFDHRYLTADVPFGLVVIKGLALLAGVATPRCDEVLLWCQRVLEKEYVVPDADGVLQVAGKDVAETRAPQRYGFASLREALKAYS